jgi:hypothetical protein
LSADVQFDIPYITYTEVAKLLNELDVKKATGLDGIDAKFIKIATPSICNVLLEIINKSIKTGIFPDDWKASKIKPLFKKGDQTEPNNYRPVSILCVLSKIMERHVHRHFYSYLTKYELITSCQSGFRSKHSTQSCLTKITDRWLTALDNGRLVGCVTVDMSKAFDTLSHNILIEKLKTYHCSANTVKWFMSYLTSRNQSVQIGKTLSEQKIIKHGVPQGSILGPLLFSLYINDLPLHIENCNIDLYADDATLDKDGNNVNEIENVLSVELNNLHNWCSLNQLVINVSKTNSILLCSAQKEPHIPKKYLSLSINNMELTHVDNVKILGVTVDKHMLWGDHIENIAAKLSSMNYLLYNIRAFLSKDLLCLFYNSYFLPHLTYCMNIWGQAAEVHLHKVQIQQNKAARLTLYAQYDTKAQPLFNTLSWMNISQRTFYETAILMYKVFNDHAPSYLNTFTTNEPNYRLRSTDQNILLVPFCKTAMKLKSHSYKGAIVWNATPNHIRSACDITSFKYALRKHILAR